jgi:hypothetical protein
VIVLFLAATAIPQMLHQIDARHVEKTVRTLVSFGTRNTLSSQDDPKRGIGAARDWLYGQFQEIAKTSDGRMTIELQTFEQAPGNRIPTATKLTNVVATLRGTESPERIYVVSGHYDSMCTSPTDAQCDAPGADDDASGVAVALEAARVMAPHKFNATIVFMAVAGEEQGLYGSGYFAKQAKEKKWNIDAMFTNDIVGNGTDTLRVFSEGIPTTESADEARIRRTVGGENDGPSRQLARDIVETAHKYLPNFHVKMVYRRDRYLRSGDHVPFLEQGYPAVRFTEPNENYHHQHQNVRVEDGVQYGDLPEFNKWSYIANVARVNTAALATLALAPARPNDVRILTARLTNDTDLQWDADNDPSFDHYEIVWRDTTAPAWTHSKTIGRETNYTMSNMSKDNYFFGVRAVSKNGMKSTVSFPLPLRPTPPVANQQLSDELIAIGTEDQEIRNRWIKDQTNQSLKDEMAAIDARHVARLREIIKQYGWPGKSMVGTKAANDAWLVAQHGGKEFLHETLPLMKDAVDKGELPGASYALSVDRTRIQDGLKQIYGSQFDTKGDKCEPQPIEDPEHVDERRKEVGLDSLADYAKTLCAMYKKKT